MSGRDIEMTVFDLFSLAYFKWRVITVSTVVGLLLAGVISVSQSNVYRSSVVLAPAENGQLNSLQSIAGGLGGLAGLAGMSLGGDSTQIRFSLAYLRSYEFLSGFIAKHDLLAEVVAANGWDPSGNVVTYDEKLYDSAIRAWVTEAGSPSLQYASELLSEQIRIDEDGSSGFVELSVTHFSPYLAKQWLDFIVSDLNEYMRNHDIEQAQRSIDYLSAQIESTSISEMNAVFYGLIEEQTKKMMLASIRDEYVFTRVGVPYVPERKIYPRRAVMVALGGALGLVLGFLIVLVREKFLAV